VPVPYLTFHEVSRPPRWNRFALGVAIDIAVMGLLLGVNPPFTHVTLRDPVASSQHVTLVAPVGATAASELAPVHPLVTRLEKPKVVPRPNVPRIQVPQSKVEPPKVEAPSIPKLAEFTTVPKKPAEEIKKDLFATAVSNAASTHEPLRHVQTGGFGDQSGVAGRGDPKRNTAMVASVGSFDAPSGTGNGNGAAGSGGISAKVRATTFGDAASYSGATEHNSGHVLAASGFGDTILRGSHPAVQRVLNNPDLSPVQIVYKPLPAYTPEARRQRIEGEVVLDVVFNASGSLQIRRVVKGLGYGLDDMAVAAAQRIQFRPARRDGQPYDCAALVHMVFEITK
jgi:TonB family protein